MFADDDDDVDQNHDDYDVNNDISYEQSSIYYSDTCTIEIIGAIENITIQLSMELKNFELDILEISDDESSTQKLNRKYEQLITILKIVNKLVVYVVLS